MGFLKNLKAANCLKRGRKHLDSGYFDKALVYFDDASRMANDQKTLFECRSWYYLTRAIHQSKLGQLDAALDSYDKFISDLHDFEVECSKTPGLGTNTRFNMAKESLLDLSIKYSQFLDKIEKY